MFGAENSTCSQFHSMSVRTIVVDVVDVVGELFAHVFWNCLLVVALFMHGLLNVFDYCASGMTELRLELFMYTTCLMLRFPNHFDWNWNGDRLRDLSFQSMGMTVRSFSLLCFHDFFICH